jgi:hypothetical protein
MQWQDIGEKKNKTGCFFISRIKNINKPTNQQEEAAENYQNAKRQQENGGPKRDIDNIRNADGEQKHRSRQQFPPGSAPQWYPQASQCQSSLLFGERREYLIKIREEMSNWDALQEIGLSPRFPFLPSLPISPPDTHVRLARTDRVVFDDGGNVRLAGLEEIHRWECRHVCLEPQQAMLAHSCDCKDKRCKSASWKSCMFAKNGTENGSQWKTECGTERIVVTVACYLLFKVLFWEKQRFKTTIKFSIRAAGQAYKK